MGKQQWLCNFATHTIRLTSCSTSLFSARSALFPARAITMLGLACLCSSFTQALARSKVSYRNTFMFKSQYTHYIKIYIYI